jgi:hypothetical protein
VAGDRKYLKYNIILYKKDWKTIKTNTFRIISGSLKGRKFSFKDSDGLRPTSGKARETLFNWLQFEIHNKTILRSICWHWCSWVLRQSQEVLERSCFIEKDFKRIKYLSLTLNF